MKIIFLVLALFACACDEKAMPPKAKDYPNIVKEIGVVNGCKVYDAWVFQSGCYDNSYGVNYRHFMMTDCHNVTLEWTCGKNCQRENGTK